MHLDTRDLIEERDKLKQEILESFLDGFPHYEEMTDSFEDIHFEEEEIESWKEDWVDELNSIREIDELESDIDNGEWDYGVPLIEDYYFEDFVEEELEQIGYIPKDFPTWIEIDWVKTANNMKQSYTEVEFRGLTYLYR